MTELLSGERLDRAAVCQAVQSIGGDTRAAEELAAALVRAEEDRRQLGTRVAELEDRLAERDERWDLLVCASQDGVWDWVPGTDFLYWSPQLTRMLGYADGEIAPSVAAFNALIHPDDHALAWRAFDDHSAGKTAVCESEFRLRAKDGSYRRIRSRAKARIDAQGRIVRMAGVHIDITTADHDRKDGARSSGADRDSGSIDLPHSRELCGSCHRDTLVRSRWRWWELPLLLLLKRPARCRSCGRRGFKPLWAGIPKWDVRNAA